MTEVSVIVPSLNEEKGIERCLKSIEKQKTTYDYEIIVSDGGSTDRTIQIANKMADEIVFSKKGIANGRNTGAKKANGKVLVFIDSDSYVPNNYLESTVPVLEDNSIGALSCCFSFDRRTPKLKMIEDICNNYLMLKGLAGKGEILGFNNVVKKSTFRKAGGFPDQPLEDGA